MKFLITAIISLSFLSTLSPAGETVDYTVNGLSYEGYYNAANAGAPLVILLHDWDGLTEYEVKRADMLTEAGYSVFAADLFGKGIRPTENVDKRQHTGELYTNREKLRALLQGALTAAKDQGANIDNTVVMGYCFGGAAALEFARAGFDNKGVVTFHGGLSTPEGQNYETTKGKILIFHGSADTHITLQDLAQLATELEAAKIPHELISYGGAPHSFTVFDSAAYTPEADTLSWSRFLDFLKEVTAPEEKSN